MDVIEQIPARVIGVLVNDEVIATVPAPIHADRPIPGSNFEIKATREPEAMVVAVDAHNVVAIAGPKMFKAAVLKRVVQVDPIRSCQFCIAAVGQGVTHPLDVSPPLPGTAVKPLCDSTGNEARKEFPVKLIA